MSVALNAGEKNAMVIHPFEKTLRLKINDKYSLKIGKL